MRVSAFIAAAALAAIQSPAMAGQRLQFINADEPVVSHLSQAKDAAVDVLTFKGKITGLDGKANLGRSQGFCLRIDVAGQSWECTFTVVLATGQISVEGPFADVGDSTMAVTGGTGAYAGARGTLLIRLQDTTPTTDLFTFDLL